MIFRYPGGKSKKKIRNFITSKFPPSYSSYIEPFVGGGSIFFSIPLDKNRWINDIDKDIISVYQILQRNPTDFITCCKSLSNTNLSHELKAVFYKLVVSDPKTLLQQAYKYYFINRTVFGGRVNYTIPSRLYFSNPTGWNIIKGNKLEKASQIIQNVKITSQSYKECFVDDSNTLIYLDPPYYKNTFLSKTSQLYRHNFTKEDHVDLSKMVKSAQSKICLSYDKCDFILDLYKNFNIYECPLTYCMTNEKSKRREVELVITNY